MKILFLMPFIIYLLIAFLLLIIGETINIYILLLSLLLLFINGYGLSKNSKKWNYIGFISIAIFTIWYSIMGYFDYFKWFSTKVAICLLAFYVLIFILKLFLNKKKK